jgi:hypothetical protein
MRVCPYKRSVYQRNEQTVPSHDDHSESGGQRNTIATPLTGRVERHMSTAKHQRSPVSGRANGSTVLQTGRQMVERRHQDGDWRGRDRGRCGICDRPVAVFNSRPARCCDVSFRTRRLARPAQRIRSTTAAHHRFLPSPCRRGPSPTRRAHRRAASAVNGHSATRCRCPTHRWEHRTTGGHVDRRSCHQQHCYR